MTRSSKESPLAPQDGLLDWQMLCLENRWSVFATESLPELPSAHSIRRQAKPSIHHFVLPIRTRFVSQRSWPPMPSAFTAILTAQREQAFLRQSPTRWKQSPIPSSKELGEKRRYPQFACTVQLAA